MGIKQLYNDNLRKLPNEYGDVSIMLIYPLHQRHKLKVFFFENKKYFFFVFFFYYFKTQHKIHWGILKFMDKGLSIFPETELCPWSFPL